MIQFVRPGVSQFLKYQKQYLEMVILFVADGIYERIDIEFPETFYGRTYILSYVNGRTVPAKHQFFIQTVA